MFLNWVRTFPHDWNVNPRTPWHIRQLALQFKLDELNHLVLFGTESVDERNQWRKQRTKVTALKEGR